MRKKSVLLIFLASWLLINAIQALFTGLFHDEAYYYFYSTDLDWGYYDHPPLIAIFIRLGYLVFQNELGVRILYVFLSIATVGIIYKLLEVKNVLLFGLMFFSFLVFHITSFMAIPDSLLVFFTALYFLAFRKYCRTHSMQDAVFLGIVMAGMFYSKYLGVLIVFFTVLSDPRLLLKRSYWLAVLVTTALFLPHLFWQYRHDFPSFYYHMVERSHDEYFRWSNFGDFIIGQFGQTNPILFLPILYFIFTFKPENRYDRALKFSASGSLLLPFLFMLKGRVEANWTMAGLVPVFLIAYRAFENRPKLYRFLYLTGGLTVVLVFLVRVVLVLDVLPEKYNRQIKSDFYGWKSFSRKVSEMAENRPVVFIGSYQYPSQYIFNTGKEAFTFNNAIYRNNQFDLEGIEERIQGKEVMIIYGKQNIPADDLQGRDDLLADSLAFPNGSFRYYKFEKDYRSYNNIRSDILVKERELIAGKEIDIQVILKNPGNHPIAFNEPDSGKVFLSYLLLQQGKPVIYDKFEDITGMELKEEYRTSFRMRAPGKPGIYYLKIAIKNRWLPPGINSRLIRIRVK